MHAAVMTAVKNSGKRFEITYIVILQDCRRILSLKCNFTSSQILDKLQTCNWVNCAFVLLQVCS